MHYPGAVAHRARKPTRGISLVEIMVVLVLLSSVSLSLMLNTRSSTERIQSQGLARALTEEIRAARAFATQEQTDVVLVFPSATGGGACRSFRVYQGEDSLQPLKTFGFDEDHESVIFLGTWPATGSWDTASTLPPGHDFPPNRNILMFRPDGSAVSNLPRLNGAYCLLVANALEFSSGEGTLGQLTAVKNPNTVLVRPTGSVQQGDRLHLASGVLPGTDNRPVVLSLSGESVPTPYDPVINKISFSPRSASVDGRSGMGKTFIDIHPVSSGHRAKEYGMATIEVEATDRDGGPLYLEVEVTPSEGKAGTLASEGPVRMEFLNGRWRGAVGWRPPAEAAPDIKYLFNVTVTDRLGRTTNAASDASVLPVLTTLADNRLAVESSDGAIYLSNLEGGELVRITPNGVQESRPMWSGDGTKLYVFASGGGGQSLVRYNADGTERVTVTSFPADAEGFQLDISGMYIGYVYGTRSNTYETWDGENLPEQTKVTTSNLSVLHVSNGEHRSVSSDVTSGFSFLPYEHGLIQYQYLVVGSAEGPLFDEEGLEVEGETTTYTEIGSDYDILKLKGLAPDLLPGEEPRVKATRASFNPYEPTFFVGPGNSILGTPKDTEDGQKLYLYQNTAEGWKNVAPLESGGGKLAEPPTWSANGEWVAYILENDSGKRLFVHNVTLPIEGKSLKVSEPKVMSFSSEVTGVVPTPGGEAVLYIVEDSGGSKLMSLRTSGDAKPIQIGRDLPGVASYAVTQ